MVSQAQLGNKQLATFAVEADTAVDFYLEPVTPREGRFVVRGVGEAGREERAPSDMAAMGDSVGMVHFSAY